MRRRWLTHELFASLLLNLQVANAANLMPWGALLFQNIDTTNGVLSYIMQIGTDQRITAASNYPDQGIRRVAMQSYLSGAYCKLATNVIGC